MNPPPTTFRSAAPRFFAFVSFLVLAGCQLAGVLSVRAVLAASVLALVLFAALARKQVNSRKEWLVLGSLLAISILVQALPEFIQRTNISFYEFGWRTSLVLLGWATALCFLSLSPPAAQQRMRIRRWHFALVIALTAIALAAAHWAIRGHYALIPDEVTYLLQSKLMLAPGFGRRLDPSLVPFFITRLAFFRDGRLIPEYTPGWPLILALFHQAGIRWLAAVVMSTLAVALTCLLGKQVRSESVGLMTAVLLATSPWFVYLGGTYMSHASTIALAVLAAWLWVLSETKQRGRVVLWIMVGVAVGLMTLTRPLTGVALSFSLWMWILFRGRIAGWSRAYMTVVVAIAAAVPLLFLLYYNRETTGNALALGYQIGEAGWNKLGFGMRGSLVYTARGVAEPAITLFSPRVALFNFLSMIRDASIAFIPAFFLAPLLFFGLRQKIRIAWGAVPLFLVLPVAHFFYWYRDVRFYSELLPFLSLAIACILDDLSITNRALARWCFAFVVAASLLLTVFRIRSEAKAYHNNFLPYFQRIADLQREHGKLLVFFADRSSHPVMFDALAWFNMDRFPGNVIVARDLGIRDTELIARWPDYFPVRVIETSDVESGRVQRPIVEAVRGRSLVSALHR